MYHPCLVDLTVKKTCRFNVELLFFFGGKEVISFHLTQIGISTSKLKTQINRQSRDTY